MEREVYRDCMRNHAATLGTYATDGCGEYTADASSPGGYECGACGCHRNFHRKVPLSACGEAGDNLLVLSSPQTGSAEERSGPEGARTAKRVRTKFSAEQKGRMLAFSEKIGWRMPRRDGGVDEVGDFCREIGVGRQIFKVWMHNHKNNNAGGGCSGGGGNGTVNAVGNGASSDAP